MAGPVGRTGAPRRSASRRSSSPPRLTVTPAPSRISGRRAVRRIAAARRTSSAAGTTGGVAACTTGANPGSSARSRSLGSSTYAGCGRAADIALNASLTAAGTSASERGRPVYAVTARNAADWSGVSWSTPVRRPISCVATWPASSRTRDESAQASAIAVSALKAPGPVVTLATPGRPETRA